MITISGLDKLKAQMEQIKKETTENMTKMVERFALHLAETASNNTPIGDQSVLDEYFSGQSLNPGQYKYVRYYLHRVQNYGINAQAGFHRGAWKFSSTGSFSFDSQIYSQNSMRNNVKNDFSSQFRLGETFYIGAEGPGYVALERGSSFQANDLADKNISKPTIDEVIAAYNANLQYFYRSK